MRNTLQRTILRGLCVLVVAASSALAGCGPEDCPPCTCTYEGQTYEAGELFSSADGGSVCTCTPDGEVECTDARRPGPSSCTYQGAELRSGDIVSVQGLEVCVCQDGQVSCQRQPGCLHEGVAYSVGQSFAAADGCNQCTCAADGSVECSSEACAYCDYAGMRYNVGDSFSAGDACGNTCFCAPGGGVVCSAEECSCDGNEQGRQYLCDAAGCASAAFDCPENTARFDNACGCGCVQSAACPAELYCAGDACDAAVIQVLCPYTQITGK